jgi:hypothetical protein
MEKLLPLLFWITFNIAALARAGELEAPLLPGAGLVVIRDSADRIVSVSLEDEKLSEGLLLRLKGAATLESLNLKGTSLDDSLSKSLSGIVSLEVLNIAQTKVTDSGIAFLSQMPRLRTLKINGCDVTDAAIPYLARCGSLRSLDASSTRITARRLAEIRSLSELVFFDATIDDAGVSAIATMPNLKVLRVRASDFGVRGITALAQQNRLSTLTISGGLDQKGVEALAGLERLEELVLRVKTDVPPASFAFLNHLPHLKKLDLAATTMTDGATRFVHGCNQLVELDLSDTKVTEAGLAELSEIKTLRRISLRQTNIHSLDALRDLNLEYIDIRDTDVSLLGISIKRGDHRHLEIRR